MTQVTADFETGTNTNQLATGDTGSATAFDAVDATAGNLVVYDTAHVHGGTLACKISNASSMASQVGFAWSTALGTVTDTYGRFYIYMTAYPSPDYCRLLDWQTGASAVAGRLYLSSAGMLIGVDSSIGAITTHTVALTLNQWCRVEYHLVNSTTVGQLETKIFNSAESGTPTETQTSAANKNTLANCGKVYHGMYNGESLGTLTMWIEDVIDGAASYPGPVAGAATPSLLYNPNPLAHLRAR